VCADGKEAVEDEREEWMDKFLAALLEGSGPILRGGSDAALECREVCGVVGRTCKWMAENLREAYAPVVVLMGGALGGHLGFVVEETWQTVVQLEATIICLLGLFARGENGEPSVASMDLSHDVVEAGRDLRWWEVLWSSFQMEMDGEPSVTSVRYPAVAEEWCILRHWLGSVDWPVIMVFVEEMQWLMQEGLRRMKGILKTVQRSRMARAEEERRRHGMMRVMEKLRREREERELVHRMQEEESSGEVACGVQVEMEEEVLVSAEISRVDSVEGVCRYEVEQERTRHGMMRVMEKLRREREERERVHRMQEEESSVEVACGAQVEMEEEVLVSAEISRVDSVEGVCRYEEESSADGTLRVWHDEVEERILVHKGKDSARCSAGVGVVASAGQDTVWRAANSEGKEAEKMRSQWMEVDESVPSHWSVGSSIWGSGTGAVEASGHGIARVTSGGHGRETSMPVGNAKAPHAWSEEGDGVQKPGVIDTRGEGVQKPGVVDTQGEVEASDHGMARVTSGGHGREMSMPVGNAKAPQAWSEEGGGMQKPGVVVTRGEGIQEPGVVGTQGEAEVVTLVEMVPAHWLDLSTDTLSSTVGGLQRDGILQVGVLARSAEKRSQRTDTDAASDGQTEKRRWLAKLAARNATGAKDSGDGRPLVEAGQGAAGGEGVAGARGACCAFQEDGKCSYGAACKFSHSGGATGGVSQPAPPGSLQTAGQGVVKVTTAAAVEDGGACSVEVFEVGMEGDAKRMVAMGVADEEEVAVGQGRRDGATPERLWTKVTERMHAEEESVIAALRVLPVVTRELVRMAARVSRRGGCCAAGEASLGMGEGERKETSVVGTTQRASPVAADPVEVVEMVEEEGNGILLSNLEVRMLSAIGLYLVGEACREEEERCGLGHACVSSGALVGAYTARGSSLRRAVAGCLSMWVASYRDGGGRSESGHDGQVALPSVIAVAGRSCGGCSVDVVMAGSTLVVAARQGILVGDLSLLAECAMIVLSEYEVVVVAEHCIDKEAVLCIASDDGVSESGGDRCLRCAAGEKDVSLSVRGENEVDGGAGELGVSGSGEESCSICAANVNEVSLCTCDEEKVDSGAGEYGVAVSGEDRCLICVASEEDVSLSVRGENKVDGGVGEHGVSGGGEEGCLVSAASEKGVSLCTCGGEKVDGDAGAYGVAVSGEDRCLRCAAGKKEVSLGVGGDGDASEHSVVGSRGDGEERGECGHENASGSTLMLEARGCSLREILVRDLSLLHGDVSSGVGGCMRSERGLLSGPRVAWGASWRGMLSALQLAMAFICGLACVDLRTSSVGQYRMAEASGAVLDHFLWCVMGWCRLLVEDSSLCFAGVQVSPRRKSTVAWSGSRGSPGFEAVCARALPSTLFYGVCFMLSGGALRWIWRACLAVMMERLACGPVGGGGLRIAILYVL